MTDNSVFEMRTAAYYTLGCKLNFAETSTIGQSLLELGIRTAQTGESADLCVINTCSVTELADKKCRYMIRRAKREHPQAKIIVTGCYAQLSPDELSAIPEVDLVVGSEHKLDLAKLLQEDVLAERDELVIPTQDIATFKLSSSFEERTRHFLKVQDGCDYSCSYCTIPKARGRSRNGSISDIVAEAKRIATAGGLEIVLTGVNVGDFGRSTGESFLDLLRALDEVEGILRYRIGSVEPNLLTPEIIDFCAQSKRIAPHFHMPLQSGNNEVLKLMRRRYTRELFTERVSYILERIPHAFIGVDVIVGTRGETPEYYADCYEYLEALPCSQLHVFSYSERRGTSALDIPYVVPIKERHRRSLALQSLSERKLRQYYEQNIGRPLRVIWEAGQDDEGYMSGYSDEYIRVGCPYQADLVGRAEILIAQKVASHSLLLV